MKLINTGLFATVLLFSVAASALTLKEAKQQGLVGETLNGYIAVVKPTTEAQALTDKINQARTEQYKSVAAENNVSVNDVAKMTGQKLVNRAEAGEYVKGINGQWLKK
ncbi:YdbL family protein [Budviciaceae bacterium CWB-B4]|uniref:YdbL family protein n=1 Tax=Limnobaculum xujianqingii TaxID=2738837 RepID=A0A9D7FT30_9GAMM|nr:YdbL family protein [Limnobaculum xujianqingii]MBK5073094.1 YdbL family protein [Limnobaculum xujianqingii]MBK5176403.1 YdbL family protein [Limnobaculum xujianqingii]